MILSQVTSHFADSGRRLFPNFWYRCSPLLLGFCLLCSFISNAHAELSLSSNTSTATAGYFQLNWSWPQAGANVIYELLEKSSTSSAKPVATRLIYRGPQTASAISGKPNGVYEYQVRAIDSDTNHMLMSNEVRVTVKHHTLTQAWLLFTLGLIIFLAILGVILYSARAYKSEA